MAQQFGTTLRNNMLDQIESTAGVSAKLRLLTGSMPSNCAAAETGTLLIAYNLASDWAANASGGTKGLSSLPLTGTAVATGAFGYARLVDNAGTTCHWQGTCGTSGTDVIVDAASVSSIGQTVNVTSWTWTAPGA